jgi:hypothetical protein
VDAADGEAERVRRECDGYVDAKLAEFEETLATALRTVSRSRAHLWRGDGPRRAGNGAVSVPPGKSGTGMDLID